MRWNARWVPESRLVPLLINTVAYYTNSGIDCGRRRIYSDVSVAIFGKLYVKRVNYTTAVYFNIGMSRLTTAKLGRATSVIPTTHDILKVFFCLRNVAFSGPQTLLVFIT